MIKATNKFCSTCGMVTVWRITQSGWTQSEVCLKCKQTLSKTQEDHLRFKCIKCHLYTEHEIKKEGNLLNYVCLGCGWFPILKSKTNKKEEFFTNYSSNTIEIERF